MLSSPRWRELARAWAGVWLFPGDREKRVSVVRGLLHDQSRRDDASLSPPQLAGVAALPEGPWMAMWSKMARFLSPLSLHCLRNLFVSDKEPPRWEVKLSRPPYPPGVALPHDTPEV